MDICVGIGIEPVDSIGDSIPSILLHKRVLVQIFTIEDRFRFVNIFFILRHISLCVDVWSEDRHIVADMLATGFPIDRGCVLVKRATLSLFNSLKIINLSHKFKPLATELLNILL